MPFRDIWVSGEVNMPVDGVPFDQRYRCNQLRPSRDSRCLPMHNRSNYQSYEPLLERFGMTTNVFD